MNHVLDVLDEVLSWDLPDDATADALAVIDVGADELD